MLVGVRMMSSNPISKSQNPNPRPPQIPSSPRGVGFGIWILALFGNLGCWDGWDLEFLSLDLTGLIAGRERRGSTRLLGGAAGRPRTSCGRPLHCSPAHWRARVPMLCGDRRGRIEALIAARARDVVDSMGAVRLIQRNSTTALADALYIRADLRMRHQGVRRSFDRVFDPRIIRRHGGVLDARGAFAPTDVGAEHAGAMTRRLWPPRGENARHPLGRQRALTLYRAPRPANGRAGVRRATISHSAAGGKFRRTASRSAIYRGRSPLTNGQSTSPRGARCSIASSSSCDHLDKAPLFRVDVSRSRATWHAGPRRRRHLRRPAGRLCPQEARSVLVRGLRAVSDFENELQMALMNRRLRPDVETVFMMPAEPYTYVSSRLVKEVVALGGSVHGLVPEIVEERLREKKLARETLRA